MIIDRFQGDPKIFLSVDGSYLHFQEGQCVMDGGLENAVMISLFTDQGWCGNVLFKDPLERIGGYYVQAIKQSVTISSLTSMGNAALKDLQWMIDSKLANNIEAVVNNPEGSQLNTHILIEPPSRDPFILLLQKNGANWIIQKIDPAGGKGL